MALNSHYDVAANIANISLTQRLHPQATLYHEQHHSLLESKNHMYNMSPSEELLGRSGTEHVLFSSAGDVSSQGPPYLLF